MADWQNRIVSYGIKPASQFTPHPSNPKFHPKAQQYALKGALDTVGWVDVVKESLHSGYLLDGHERIWQALAQGDDTPVPYIVLDVTEDEELFILATLDPIGQMALHDAERTRVLLEQGNSDNAAIQAMLTQLGADVGIIPPDNPYDEWQGMPEFEQEDLRAVYSVKVNFVSLEDLQLFSKLVGQTLTDKTRSIWYPPAEIGHYADKRYVNES